MTDRQSFTKLREALTYLYEDETAARRVAHDADLEVRQISFSNRSVDNWNNILLQAQKEGKMANLMAVTFREFKESEVLAKAWHDYLVGAGRGTVSKQGDPSAHPSQRWAWVWLSALVAISIILGAIFLGPFIWQFLGFSLVTTTSVLPTVAPVLLADTPTPVPTFTSLPIPTNTFIPSTNTPKPETPAPIATSTPIPVISTSTNTALPINIHTLGPPTAAQTITFTNTPLPTLTDTPTPTSTFTPVPPIPTNTVMPSTPTPRPLSRCEITQRDFPQTIEAVAAKFNVPVNAIFDIIRENCGSIVDGFILRGSTEVEIEVPNGGCIDAPPNAVFSQSTVSDGFGGLRAYEGTVRAGALTYRIWCSR